MLKTCLEIITEKERGMKLFSWIHMFLTLFMPPTLKSGEHIAFGLCVRPSIRSKISTLKICIHDISKTIIARSFKLCQLIEDDE